MEFELKRRVLLWEPVQAAIFIWPRPVMENSINQKVNTSG